MKYTIYNDSIPILNPLYVSANSLLEAIETFANISAATLFDDYSLTSGYGDDDDGPPAFIEVKVHVKDEVGKITKASFVVDCNGDIGDITVVT